MLQLNSGSCNPLPLTFKTRGTLGPLTEVLHSLLQNEKQLLLYFPSQRKAVLENADATRKSTEKKSLDVKNYL